MQARDWDARMLELFAKIRTHMAARSALAFASILFAGSVLPMHAQEANQGAALRADAGQKWGQVVREIIHHELDAEAKDTSLWCYRKLEEKKDDKQRLFVACQARGAEIDRLLAVNGKELDERQQQEEDQRIESLLGNKRQLEKEERKHRQDAKQAAELLKIIPDAFVFQMEGRDGDKIKLKFAPNPAFHPSDHQAMVFHHMEGTLTLQQKEGRLAEINGRLNSNVKFGEGLLGHLDQGGTFLVRLEEVSPHCWEMTTLDVHMNGKALFFHTIDVREKEIDSDFRPLPASVTIQQAAEMTRDKITEAAAMREFGGSKK
jgi:hypothetical protein